MVGADHPSAWLTVVLCATGLFWAVVLARAEWRRYRSPTPAEKPFATFSRLSRRWFGSFLIAVLMLMLLVGVHGIDFRDRALLLLGYWGLFCLFVVLLALVGLTDLLDTHRILHLQRSEALRQALEKEGSEASAPERRTRPE